MTRIPLIRVASLLPIRDFLWCVGANVDQTLRSVELPAAVFDYPELFLPYSVVARFLERAAHHRGETVGAHAGLATRLETLGIFGRRIATAPTLSHALATAAHIAPAYSGETFWLTPIGDDVRLCHRFPRHVESWGQQMEQFSLCVALRFLTSIVAPEWQPIIHLKKGMPRTVADLHTVRDSVLVFDQPGWAITFPRALLHSLLPTPRVTPPTADELAWWEASAPGRDVATAVMQVIHTAIVGGGADVRLVADWIGTSTRTLQRRLEDAGVTYAQLVAKARFLAATRLFDEDRITLQEISRKLGYSDPAHFTRAFRRWTGVPPRTFRELRTLERTALAAANSARWQTASVA